MVEFGFDPVISGVKKPTSLQFGVAPGDENRLYVSEQNGTIKIYDVTSQPVDVVDGQNNVVGQTLDYSATLAENIFLVKDMPNYDDDGSLSSTENRQITGILVAEENGEPVIYVSSSDPRIGGNKDSIDTNLDTNSGVISKLTLNDQGEWEKIDLVRGLPRSEENHSVNGMVLTPEGKMLIAVGGHTNAGAPSNNLVYTPEYWLSASILEIDLPAIEAMPVQGQNTANPYIYDLPTLDVKGNNFDHPFGGDNGFNQAYLEPGGPVEIYATGFRNNYDLALVEDPSAPEGFHLYTWDNGPNNGWGGPPADANGVSTTNNNGTGANNQAGAATNFPNEQNSNPLPAGPDQLIKVERGGYYGHPTPARANPDTALYEKPENGTPFGKAFDEFIVDDQGDNDPLNDELLGLEDFLPKVNGQPIDPLNGYQVDPLEGVYLKPKFGGDSVDGTLVLSDASTNGIFIYEYEEGTDPDLQELDGDLFAAAFDEQILRVEFNEAGDQVLNLDDIENDQAWQTSPGNNPLDLVQGPNGSIWVASHGGNSIFAFVPGGVPEEETDNFDDDALTNSLDPFGYDPDNGLGANSAVGVNQRISFDFNNSLENPNGLQGWVLGLTGHMADYETDHFGDGTARLSGVLDGGIAGRLQIEFDAVTDGSPIGSANDAVYFLQTGVTPNPGSDQFIVETSMLNPWAAAEETNGDNLGLHFGTGTQFDFVYLAYEVQNGAGKIVMTIELNDEVYSVSTYDAPGLLDVSGGEFMTLRALVDVVNNTVTPIWSYETDDPAAGPDGVVEGVGQAISLDHDANPNTTNNLEDVIRGQYVVRNAPENGEQGDPIFGPTFQGVPSALAIGVGGARGSATQTTSFAPEFDALVFAGSKLNGDFDPVVFDDTVAGGAAGETVVIDPATLLANDVEYNPDESLSVIGVSNATGGAVSLVDGQILFVGDGSGPGGFDYTVSDGQGTKPVGRVTVTEDGGAPPTPSETVVYRINAGGPTVAAIDGGPAWVGSTADAPSPFLSGEILAGSATTPVDMSRVDAAVVPEIVFNTDHWDKKNTPEAMQWAFPVEVGATYRINLYTTENKDTVQNRLFDVALEGETPPELDNIQPFVEGGNQPRGASVRTVTYTAQDGVLNLDYIAVTQQAQVHAIEVIRIDGAEPPADGPVVSLGGDQIASEAAGTMSFEILLDSAAKNVDGVTTTLRIKDGAASAGVDFTAPGAVADGPDLLVSVEIPAGQASASAPITLIDRPGVQPSRSFSVEIESATGSNATVDPSANAAQGVILDDDAAPPAEGEILYRVNAGGETIAALDGGPAWQAASADQPSPYSVGETLLGRGLNAVDLGLLDPGVVPEAVFFSDMYDRAKTPEAMAWAFPVLAGGTYEIRLYVAENKDGNADGSRFFDVSVEGAVPAPFEAVNPALDGGGVGVASVVSAVVTLDPDDALLEFETVVGQKNPAISAVEIIALGGDAPDPDPGAGAAADAGALAVAGQPIAIDALANDAAGATLVAVGAPAQGSAAIENGVIVYTPGSGAAGVDSFSYSVSVGGQISSATVSATILAPVGDVLTAPGGGADLFGGSAVETAIGSASGEKINAGGGDDLVLGGAGDDVLYGAKDNDRVFGGAGDDKLTGNLDNDTLNGGAGDDTLKGGGGADLFAFTDDAGLGGDLGADVIEDFEVGVDQLEVGDFFGSAAEALAAVSEAGGDAVLTLGAEAVAVLQGVSAAALSESDFLF